jgi:hypothetical protein
MPTITFSAYVASPPPLMRSDVEIRLGRRR